MSDGGECDAFANVLTQLDAGFIDPLAADPSSSSYSCYGSKGLLN